MKKFSLMIACVGIISSAVFASKHFPADYQTGKTAPKAAAKTEQTPVKPATTTVTNPTVTPKPVSSGTATSPATAPAAPRKSIKSQPVKRVAVVTTKSPAPSNLEKK